MMHTPAILQTIHTLDRRPRLLREHLAEIDRAMQSLYSTRFRVEVQEVEQAITTLLERERYPLDRSVGVVMAATASEEWQLEAVGEALYQGYVLRALRPEACTLRFDLPFEGLSTSASEAAWQLAHTVARQRDVGSVVRINREGVLCEGDGSPLYAAVGRTLYTSTRHQGVEAMLAAEAIRRAGYTWKVEPLREEYLPQIEELFYVDYRGITALGSCNKKLMMSAMAERVAVAMESIFRKI